MRAIAVVVLMSAFCVRAQKNLVKNPGFEELSSNGRPVAWSVSKPVYEIKDGAGRNGSRGLAYDNSDPAFYSVPSQRVEAEPGENYKFSVWVRTSALKGDESGATICLQWSDSDGNFLGGGYPAGVKGDSDWVQIKGNARIPPQAASVSISPYVRQGMTGRAWFDDLALELYIPPVVGDMCGSAYRGISSGETLRYFVELNLAGSKLAPDMVSALFAVKNKAGESVFSSDADFVGFDQASIAIDTSMLAAGAYTVEFLLKAKDGRALGAGTAPLVKMDKFPAYKVYIDSHKRAIVNGKPFFPLGMYWSTISPKKLDTFAQGPFNCLMPYGMPTKKQVDMLHDEGLKVIYSVKDIYSGTRWAPKNIKTPADEVEFLKQKVREFKDHPALLAWYINDELPLTMLDRLSARRDLMEELDPDHPTWVVLYQYNRVRSYIPSFDVIGTDPYPIPNKPVGMALEWSRETRAQTYDARPIWQVPQVFDWAGYKKGKERENFRAPTLDEMRSMAWQCVAGGANGLVFYSFFDLYKMTERDPFEQRWQEVCEMAREIKRLIPVMLSVDPARSCSWIKSAQIETRAWSYQGETYLLAVNGGAAPAEARLLLNKAVQRVAVEFGDAPEKIKGDEYRFNIDPLKPVMIRFKK